MLKFIENFGDFAPLLIITMLTGGIAYQYYNAPATDVAAHDDLFLALIYIIVVLLLLYGMAKMLNRMYDKKRNSGDDSQ